MNWTERYAMAKDDTIDTLIKKIRTNASTYFTYTADPPHQWIANYDLVAKEHGSDNHEALRKVCYENSDAARNLAVNKHKMFYAHTKMWGQLGYLHSQEQQKKVKNDRSYRR
jgi:hypothetical protein